MQPAWHSHLDNFQNKFRIGALASRPLVMGK
jgi:hypothetical protein